METRSAGPWTVHEAAAEDEDDVEQVRDLAAAAEDAPGLDVRTEKDDERVIAAVRPAGGCGGCGQSAGLSLLDVLRFARDAVTALLVGAGLGALLGMLRNRAVV